MTRQSWAVRLSASAEADYDAILRWTMQRFGVAQAEVYARTLAASLARLERGPTIPGARRRDEIAAGLLTIHAGRRARHVILFRVAEAEDRAIDVLRILHEAMDIGRHVPESE
ncbi:MAG TPA: type II toxin-antitoxin system RelE/ParE family toxin [Acetobacteraceae bacterium]|nr:type II toxin-antitoxin system RelE/ParE family toxin [Acetobacteraceae bacterium]